MREVLALALALAFVPLEARADDATAFVASLVAQAPRGARLELREDPPGERRSTLLVRGKRRLLRTLAPSGEVRRACLLDRATDEAKTLDVAERRLEVAKASRDATLTAVLPVLADELESLRERFVLSREAEELVLTARPGTTGEEVRLTFRDGHVASARTRGASVTVVAFEAEASPGGELDLAVPPGTVVARDRADEVPGFLRDWARSMSDVRSLHVEFVQTKSLKILRKPLVSRGTLDLKGKRVLLVVRDEAGAVETELGIDVDRQEARLHFPRLKRVEVYATGQGGRSPFPFMSGEIESLPENHRLRLFAETEGTDARDVLVLAPRSGEPAEETTLIFREGRVVAVRKVRGSERVQLEISTFEKNAAVSDAAVELRVPEGTSEVRPFAPSEAPPR